MVQSFKTEPTLEGLDWYLTNQGIEHFSAFEVCAMRKAKNAIAVPPKKVWHNIVPTLRLAEILRTAIGNVPLSVGNGHRHFAYNKAVGGAPGSTHISFQALDLDLPKGASKALQEKFYKAACSIYIELGKEYKMGLGLYRYMRGTRVHIDTGKRRRYWKRKYVKPLLKTLR